MPRKARMTWPNGGRNGGEVTRRVFDPGTGWTLGEARALLEQGYAPAQVAKMTGYPQAMIVVGTSHRPARL